jgi:hypothetical protein
MTYDRPWNVSNEIPQANYINKKGLDYETRKPLKSDANELAKKL